MDPKELRNVVREAVEAANEKNAADVFEKMKTGMGAMVAGFRQGVFVEVTGDELVTLYRTKIERTRTRVAELEKKEKAVDDVRAALDSTMGPVGGHHQIAFEAKVLRATIEADDFIMRHIDTRARFVMTAHDVGSFFGHAHGVGMGMPIA